MSEDSPGRVLTMLRRAFESGTNVLTCSDYVLLFLFTSLVQFKDIEHFNNSLKPSEKIVNNYCTVVRGQLPQQSTT